MAIRKIVKDGDPILRSVCKPVEVFDEKLHRLLDDMQETLKEAQGVGLAAPQVGYCRRLFIMDLGGDEMIEAINPEIVKTSGKQRVMEGCLSCPNKWGYVTRPKKCRLKAQNRFGEWYELILTDLGAQCACHENDHLDGKLFVDIVERFLTPEEMEAE
ncbi:MAG: peptide deformylase [Ruminococcus sp.]